MPELKTRPTDANVNDFVAHIDDAQKQADAHTLIQLMSEVSGEPALMWGANMIGFGSYRYPYASGHQGEFFALGFSPRKNNLTLYMMNGFENEAALMTQLGKHKTGKSCLYIRRLSDVNMPILRTLLEKSLIHLKTLYPD